MVMTSYLFYYFLINKIYSSFVDPKSTNDSSSSYTFEEQICILMMGVDVSSSRNEDWVILEICLPFERVTSLVPFDSPFPYFYFYPPFIKDMGVIFPLSAFSTKIFRVLNVSPSQQFSNSRGYIRTFEMVYKELDVNLTAIVFCSFFVTKSVKGSYVTLSYHQVGGLFTHHSNNYKYWKDKFSRVMGREDSLGTFDVDGVPLFPLSWTEDPKIVTD